MTIAPRRCWAAVAICVGVGVACGRAGPTPSPFVEADSLVSAWVEAERIPGAVLRVERDGRTLFERAYGAAQLYDYGEGQYRDPGGLSRMREPIPMTPGTLFDLASVTKVMATTLATMVLVDEGELDLDAPVSTYLPDFVEDGRSEVTLRHLLSHTSGLPQWVPTYYHARNADEAYAYLRGLPLQWGVGEGRHYSDLGFMLLGRVIEEVTGQRLDDFVASALYAPLGLHDTGFTPAAVDRVAATSHGNPFERRMVHDPSFGYEIPGDADQWAEWRERTLRGEVNDANAYHGFGGVAGHAGLFSTAADLGVLLDLVLSEGESAGRRYFSPAVARAFQRPALDGQAMGWQLPSYAPDGSFGHTGFTGTFVLGVPELDLAIVLLTNRQNVGVDAETRYPDVSPLQQAVTDAVMAALRE